MPRGIRLNPSDARRFARTADSIVMKNPNSLNALFDRQDDLMIEREKLSDISEKARDHNRSIDRSIREKTKEMREMLQKSEYHERGGGHGAASAYAKKAADLKASIAELEGKRVSATKVRELAGRLGPVKTELREVSRSISKFGSEVLRDLKSRLAIIKKSDISSLDEAKASNVRSNIRRAEKAVFDMDRRIKMEGGDFRDAYRNARMAVIEAEREGKAAIDLRKLQRRVERIRKADISGLSPADRSSFAKMVRSAIDATKAFEKKLKDRSKDFEKERNAAKRFLSSAEGFSGLQMPKSSKQKAESKRNAQIKAWEMLYKKYKDRVKPHVRRRPDLSDEVEHIESQFNIILRKLQQGDPEPDAGRLALIDYQPGSERKPKAVRGTDVGFDLARLEKKIKSLQGMTKPRQGSRGMDRWRKGLQVMVDETAEMAKKGATVKEIDLALFRLDEFSRSFSAKEKAELSTDDRREISSEVRKIQKALRMLRKQAQRRGSRKKNPCVGLHFHGKDADELLMAMEASAKRQQLEAKSKRKMPNPMHHVPKKATKAQVRSTVSKNIGLLMEEGYPQKQAVAIALTRAREDAPRQVLEIYGPKPNPSTNPYLGDAVERAKKKMGKPTKVSRKTPPPLPEKMRKRSMVKTHRVAVSNPGILIDNPRRLAPPPAMKGYSKEAFEAASPRAFELLTRALMDRKERAKPGKKRPVTKQRAFLRKVEDRKTGTANLIAAKALDDEGYSDNSAELAIASKLRSFAEMLLKKTPTEFRNFVDSSTRIRSAVAPDVRRIRSAERTEIGITAQPTRPKRGGRKAYGSSSEEPGAMGVTRGIARVVDDPDLYEGYGSLYPNRRNNPKNKTKKKSAKRKAPLAKTLISKCQKTWDHYCAKPSKKRLEEVFDHLEVMKESSAKTVKEERARCLRAANKEAKRLKMKR